MRRTSALVLMVALAGAGGCKVLNGYILMGHHYRFGSVKEKQFGKSVKALSNSLKIVLNQQDFGIKSWEVNDEDALIRASKDGLEWVFEIKSVGSGSTLHVEVDQAGNDDLIYGVLKDLEFMP